MAGEVSKCPECHGARGKMTQQGPQICNTCKGAGVVGSPGGQYLRAIYTYLLFNQPLTALQAISGSLQIDARADFEWVWGVATSTGTFTTILTDKSDRPLQSDAVNNANQWGTAQLPFTLPVPMVLPMKTSVKFTITDTSNAPNTVQIALVGYELYPQLQNAGAPVAPNGPGN